MWALILMKEGMIIMNNKHNPIKNFYSIKNNESISFDAEDALSLVFASCLNHDCEVSKCTSFNYFRDLKLRILYAEIKKIINCMDKGDYDLSQLVDDHILRSAFAGSVFMKDGMGASYLVEAVIVCKQLLARQNVIIAGEIYRQVAEQFHVSPEAVEKAIRYFTKELWMVCKDKTKCLAIYNFVFPSLNSPPTNKDTIVFMAIKMLEIQKLLEAVAI